MKLASRQKVMCSDFTYVGELEIMLDDGSLPNSLYSCRKQKIIHADTRENPYPKTSKINDIARAYSLAFWLSEDITMNRTQKRV